MRKTNDWIWALQFWNNLQKKDRFCIPKAKLPNNKTNPEYKEVKTLMKNKSRIEARMKRKDENTPKSQLLNDIVEETPPSSPVSTPMSSSPLPDEGSSTGISSNWKSPAKSNKRKKSTPKKVIQKPKRNSPQKSPAESRKSNKIPNPVTLNPNTPASEIRPVLNEPSRRKNPKRKASKNVMKGFYHKFKMKDIPVSDAEIEVELTTPMRSLAPKLARQHMQKLQRAAYIRSSGQKVPQKYFETIIDEAAKLNLPYEDINVLGQTWMRDVAKRRVQRKKKNGEWMFQDEFIENN